MPADLVKKVEPAGSTPQAPFPGGAHERLSPSHRHPTSRILCPTNFSPRDTKTVHEAVTLARALGARLTLLHVIDINDPAWVRFAGSSSDFMRLLRSNAHEHMEQLVQSLAGERIEVRTLIVEGVPWEEILQRTHQFDLVMMSHPRPQPFWRLFSRKTIQRVIAQSQCEVVVVQE
jgi:nucleotide-binding universal stress UspA family protein